MTLSSLRYTRPEFSAPTVPATLSVLDQLQLPHKTVYITINTAEEATACIRSMKVRGAPAIAIVAVLSLAVELQAMPLALKGESKEAYADDTFYDASGATNTQRMGAWIESRLAMLLASRPTAVNLAEAIERLRREIESVPHRRDDPQQLRDRVVAAAEELLDTDAANNIAIGAHGADWLLNRKSASGSISVVTHCNTGSLATAGYGTALGIIRTLHARSRLSRVYYTETRPYNQGSRLTAYELLHDQIPATLVTDSMVAALLRLKGQPENISAIVVGADRVAANGDTANKIGTYALALLARHHGLSFVVAAPRTTIDRKTRSGDDIVIEERPGDEVTRVTGPVWPSSESSAQGQQTATVSTAAAGLSVWNPAFDVTPAQLIDAIITEAGAVERGADGNFNLDPLFEP